MLRRTVAALAVAASCALFAVPFATGRADAAQSGGTTLAATPPNQSSGVDCSDRVNYTPFTFLGDTNQYYLTQNGDFESGSGAWFGAGVSLTSDNEPWHVGGSSDSNAVLLSRTGATLSAPPMCVKQDEPTMRFFYKAPGIAGSSLVVHMWTTSTAGTSTKTVTLDGSTAGWQVSDPIHIDDNTDQQGQQKLYLDFTSQGGAWTIDDVYVDPWKYVIQ